MSNPSINRRPMHKNRMQAGEKPKDFKKNPDQYKGHVGHVSTVIRVALMGRQQSPDVWEIQQILGEERTRARLAKFI